MSSVCFQAGHALSIGAAARVDHVLEGVDAERPRREIALHEPQVAIVLQAFLEFVRREQVIEVARLRRVRQVLQLPVPADLVALVVRDDGVEQPAVADRRDRLVDALRLPGRTPRRRTCTAPQPACSHPAAHRRTAPRDRIPARPHRAGCGRAAPATARALWCSASPRSPPSRRRAEPCSIAGLPGARAAAPSWLRRRCRPSAMHSRARDSPCRAAPRALRSARRSGRPRRAASAASSRRSLRTSATPMLKRAYADQASGRRRPAASARARGSRRRSGPDTSAPGLPADDARAPGRPAARRESKRSAVADSSQIVALIPDLGEIEPGAVAHIERHVVVEQRA